MADHDVVAVLADLAADQAGVLCRSQLIALGMSVEAVRAQIAAGRWQRLHPAIYATFTGPVPIMARIWAASLHAGRGAILCGATALWLTGSLTEPPGLIRVCVPHGRKVVPLPGMAVTSSRHADLEACSAARPARMRVEEALLDEVDRASSTGAVIGLVLQVVQSRTTTAGRVRAAMDGRPRLRRRELVRDLLEDAAAGVQSRLEHRYLGQVERAHGLPRGERNLPERVTPVGGDVPRTRYRDVRYRRWGVLVELDGVRAHPAAQAWWDRLRDNEAMIDGDRTLRYGWLEVMDRPCTVAAQVTAGLRAGGWTGSPRRCGPGCTLPPDA